ncbi:hypothetical protein SARC_10858 [Sphaeroforma arctica JP610]|uniref:Uncharacterized protein n=1 Tax=Sphaeroforma arctica JP610 TaxID=667725 RepID=A0A0L0FJL2_9EUKA|nr:hypothetical protein SARC_10858 [Sphaeroforma arctica JP610]KNC76646.1 hypothetical protein SARC_10858 [Sphaeroforma arctica JP610]|eukprot:XP_014150548.1 hypothetical protein SARC_10858 [Sphaeroforma arctica JP610]
MLACTCILSLPCQTIEFGFQPEEVKQTPVVETKLLANSGANGHSYNLEVKATADGPIGKFDKATVYITNSQIQNASNPFYLSGPIYVIFNPYNKADETYCPHEDMRRELLEYEYGRIYNGWAHDYFDYLWYFAQFDQSTLDSAFYLLSLPEMDQRKINSASDIATFVSTNLGWYWKNDTDHSQGIVGIEKGLVQGRWSDDLRDYPNGTDPEAWTSTLEIINEWKVRSGCHIHLSLLSQTCFNAYAFIYRDVLRVLMSSIRILSLRKQGK